MDISCCFAERWVRAATSVCRPVNDKAYKSHAHKTMQSPFVCMYVTVAVKEQKLLRCTVLCKFYICLFVSQSMD